MHVYVLISTQIIMIIYYAYNYYTFIVHGAAACMQDFEDSSVVLTKAQWAEQELAQVSYHMHASVY